MEGGGIREGISLAVEIAETAGNLLMRLRDAWLGKSRGGCFCLFVCLFWGGGGEFPSTSDRVET